MRSRFSRAAFALLVAGAAGCGAVPVRTGFGDTEIVPAASPYSPTPEATAATLALVAKRAPFAISVSSDEAREYLSDIRIVYTADPIDVEATGPGLVVTGYTWGRLVTVLVDAKRCDDAHNALVHELVHVLLWRAHGNPASGHAQDPSGLWTRATDGWISAVMADDAT